MGPISRLLRGGRACDGRLRDEAGARGWRLAAVWELGGRGRWGSSSLGRAQGCCWQWGVREPSPQRLNPLVHAVGVDLPSPQLPASIYLIHSRQGRLARHSLALPFEAVVGEREKGEGPCMVVEGEKPPAAGARDGGSGKSSRRGRPGSCGWWYVRGRHQRRGAREPSSFEAIVRERERGEGPLTGV